MSLLREIIAGEIARQGTLPFARFMELALYCPKHGYYETKKDNPGRQGDFYTSVGTGKMFGELLGCQFAGWLEEMRIADCGLRIVEAGAHDAGLARDILDWLRLRRPQLFGQIEYWLIEPSVQRQAWQIETLKDFAPRVQWFSDFDDLRFKTQNRKLTGIIFSNELLDAMPIHRFGWDAAKKTWYEWGVAVEAEKFIWAKIQPSAFSLQPSALESVLPDGYIVEACPAAENWWRKAAGVLERGKLMAIDYGLTVEELISPSRPRGTLRAYFRHHASDDVLANVGEQDLTAHVNFTAIQSAGESVGLKTEIFQTQSQFLVRILENLSRDPSTCQWNSSQVRQLQTLTHPEHLGRAFRVLVQSRQVQTVSPSRFNS